MTQSFATREGARQNRFVLAEDEKTLTEQVTITSPTLPRPIAYTLTYTREATETASR